jgi:hypothetical protein
MKFLMQVKVEDPSDRNKLVWRSVRLSAGHAPYEYDTREEASRMLQLCYGDAVPSDRLRVIPANES